MSLKVCAGMLQNEKVLENSPMDKFCCRFLQRRCRFGFFRDRLIYGLEFVSCFTDWL